MATTVETIPQAKPRPDQVLVTIDGQEVACDRGDTILDAAVGSIDARQVLPGAFLVGVVILVLGLCAIRWYERSGEA